MGEVVIVIPGVPESGLLPNRIRGVHWAKIDRLRQQQKADAKLETLQVFNGQGSPVPADVPVIVRLRVLWPKSRIFVDLDNLVAGVKGLIDGVFLALERDDACIEELTICQGRAPDGDKAGCVEVTVRWT